MQAFVGRSYDLCELAEFLESVDAQPFVLSIEGDAGIGRSTLWLAALSRARELGFHTLSACASKAEAGLEYGTVADLLGEVDPDLLKQLPEAHAAAVDRVLLRGASEPCAVERHLVAAALLRVIRRLSRSAPVIVGVDDVQWLDECSRDVVAYVARRLGPRATLLITERREAGHVSTLAWLQLALPDAINRRRVGPMSMSELHQLFSARLGRSFPPPTMRRIEEISAGNPFYALELARAINRGPTDGEPDLLPRRLVDLVRVRVEDLSTDAQRILLAAACLVDPTVTALADATSTSVERTIELLDDAVREGVIAIDGNRVDYCHPLLARGVYTATGPAQRREMHSMLANVVSQPDLRVRHRALAASNPEPDLLNALDRVADAARARGAPVEAAELLDLAIRLGGDTPLRRTHSAQNHLRAGNSVRAGDLLSPAIEKLPPGPERAFAMTVLAGTRLFHNGFDAAADLLKRAVDEGEGYPLIVLQALLALAFAQSIACDYGEALRIAKRAVAVAEDVGVPALLSQALANYVTINALDGQGIDQSALETALELEDPDLDVPIVFHASAAEAQVLAWTGSLDRSRAELHELRRRCVERGADSDLIFVSVHTAMVEIWRSRFDDAAQAAEEAVELAEQIGGEHMVAIARTIRAAAAAYVGREREARADIAAANAAVERCGSPGLAYWPTAVQGFLEVSLGNHAAAATALQQRCDEFPDMPGTEIVTASFIPDAVEALVALGRITEAEPMVKALEHNGRLFDRPWMLAIGARCRAMVLGAQGDVEAAERAAHEALVLHGRLQMPFEQARTQLVLGQLQHRRRQKIATATIASALRLFEDIGSELWAARARAELERTTAVRTNSAQLTPPELRVVELVITGIKTADVAAQLCVSAKTVEAKLTRIYRKLGIHSRAELSKMMGASARKGLEGDAISAVEGADQFDGPPFDIERPAVQQEHQHRGRRLE